MARHVIAFIGQNENGILRELSRGFNDLLAPLGLEGHVLDLLDPGWRARFSDLLTQGIAFAWGSAGVGARLPLEGENLWDALRIPFVSVLADHPCLMPVNHRVAARYVVNGYMYRDWYDVQRRWVRSPQVSAVLPHGVPPNPHADAIPWPARPRGMVFVKTGGDPEARRARWQDLPLRTRAVLEDAAEAASGDPREVTALLVAAAEARSLHLSDRPEVLFRLAYELDGYARERRATLMARALLHLPATVIGRGWEHVAGEATRATFLPALDAAELPRLYGETRFLLNTTPNIASGVHERVPMGFAAGCVVVSDANAFMRDAFADLPTFHAVRTDDPDLPDRLGALLEDPRDRGPETAPAREVAATRYDGRLFSHALLELAAEAGAYAAWGEAA